MNEISDHPVIDASRIDAYGSLMTAVQTTMESRGWAKFRANEWECPGFDPKPVVRFSYAHLEWRIIVRVGNRNNILHVFVRDASVPLPGTFELCDWIEARVAESPARLV